MAEQRAQRFIDALHQLEDDRDAERIVGMFADSAELSNPHIHDPLHGRDGAHEFWTTYRDTFGEIHSDFHLVVEQGDGAILEWTSRGTASHGARIEYDGVSVLEFGDGGIRRFRAYFDPAALGDQLEASA